MRFRPPFDLAQRNAAAAFYRQNRDHFHLMKRGFPPSTDRQRKLLVQLEARIHEFGCELQKPFAKVNVKHLNTLADSVRVLGVRYGIEKYQQDIGG